MAWLHFVSYLFSGFSLYNAIPHFLSGVIGRPFQSPFATPPGQGLSCSIIDVLWGFYNLGIAHLLLCRVGDDSLRSTVHAIALGAGFLVMGLFGARHFGRFHGGNSPEDSSAH